MKNEKRVAIRIEAVLHAKARAKAALVGKSLSGVVRDYLASWTSDMQEPELEERVDK